ncbi:MAG: glycosyltransferase [Syntrophobacteraceae bacterium]
MAAARILFFIIGIDKPSSRKRILDSVPFLESRGHAVTVREFPKGIAGRIAMIAEMRRYDLVVVQKKLLRPFQMFLMKRFNPMILFDLDDAVMFHEIERGEVVTGKFFRRFVTMAAGCKGVIAGNGYLAELARAARVRPGIEDDGVLVLPTPVNTSMLLARPMGNRSERVVIGWVGTRGNLRHLRRIAGALRTVRERHDGTIDVLVKVVSDAKPELPGIRLEYKPWSAADEAADLQSFDIGVMPLADDLWTRGKGGYKLLQYMAAGAAAIASPVGINREIVQHGENGLLAADEHQWTNALDRLIADASLRERLAGAARETVERHYSLESYNQRLAAFLERML